MSSPEVWLRGPVPGFLAELQPVAHALLQAREDVERLLADASAAELTERPGGAASAAFHVYHMAGSLDRLLTYARGAALDEAQQARLRAERGRPPGDPEVLRQDALRAVDAALTQVRGTSRQTLDEHRPVGRAALPATVRGLLFHAAEHSTRHVGQLSTTLRVVRGLGGPDPTTNGGA
jgi:uncharacterized damage-inducible protein DinB